MHIPQNIQKFKYLQPRANSINLIKWQNVKIIMIQIFKKKQRKKNKIEIEKSCIGKINYK